MMTPFTILGIILFGIQVVNSYEMSIAENCDCGYNDPATNTNWNELWHINFSDLTNYVSENKQQLYKNKDFFFSNYVIPAKFNDSYARIFRKENVLIHDESLQIGITVENTDALNLPTGNQQIRCGGIGTTRQDLLYGSFRSYMRTTKVNGTVAGMFLFHPDGEIDIELLSSVKPSQAYFAVHPGITESNGRASSLTHGNQELGFDPTEDYHEYRFDWYPGLTVFYIDGIEKYRITTNVLALPSKLMFNHWTDGNPNFSQGPAKQDAFLNVKNMTLFFNSSDPLVSSPKCISTNRTCDLKKIMDTLKDKNNIYDSYLSGEPAYSSNQSTATTSVTMFPSMITASSSVMTLEETGTSIQRNLSMASTCTIISLLNLITILCLAYLFIK